MNKSVIYKLKEIHAESLMKHVYEEEILCGTSCIIHVLI